MSMIGHFFLLSDREARAARSSRKAVDRLIDAAYDGRQRDLVDVDKAWHCLHFLLTGTAWAGKAPLDFIVRGGTEVGEDTGYGRPRLFGPRNVKAIAEALDRIDASVLAGRFDPARMDRLEIYPHGGWRTVDLESRKQRAYFLGPFDALKDLVRRGRTAGQALLVWLA